MVGGTRSRPCDVGRKEHRRTCRRAVASLALAAVANSFSLAPGRQSAWSPRLVRPASAAQRRVRRQTLTAALQPVKSTPDLKLEKLPEPNEYLLTVRIISSLTQYTHDDGTVDERGIYEGPRSLVGEVRHDACTRARTHVTRSQTSTPTHTPDTLTNMQPATPPPVLQLLQYPWPRPYAFPSMMFYTRTRQPFAQTSRPLTHSNPTTPPILT